jgi:hypothetical protein
MNHFIMFFLQLQLQIFMILDRLCSTAKRWRGRISPHRYFCISPCFALSHLALKQGLQAAKQAVKRPNGK